MCLKRECHSLGFIVMFRGGCRGVMLRSCSRQILWRKRKSGCVCSFWASCRRPVPLVQALLSITDFGWLLMMSSGDGLGSFLSSWCLIQTFLPACRSAADLLLETEQLLYVWHVDKSRRINHVTCAFFLKKKKKGLQKYRKHFCLICDENRNNKSSGVIFTPGFFISQIKSSAPANKVFLRGSSAVCGVSINLLF